MIILPEHSAAIVTPPKCASSSLHAALCPPGIYSMGPMPGPEPVDIEAHSPIIPRRYLFGGDDQPPCRPVLIVRNPYHRAASLWAHGVRENKYPTSFDGRFEAFIREQLIEKTYWWHWPCSRYLSKSNFIDRAGVEPFSFIRLEELAAGLGNLGVSVDLPTENAGKWVHKNFTPEAIALINTWAEDDFHRFGYEMIGSDVTSSTSVLEPEVFQQWRLH